MTDVSAISDSYVQHLRAARDTAAVLKLRLATLRAEFPQGAILIFEGDDDKIVYRQWISRVRSAFFYEAFVCGGKREAKKLVAVLTRDMNNLRRDIFFFVDRDFNDLDGFDDISNVFMTDRYSIENYLVDEAVVEGALEVDFPFEGMPAIRAEIVAKFSRCYDLFLIATEDINRRLHLARRHGITLTSKLPDGIGKLAAVSVDNVVRSAIAAEDLVEFDVDIPEDVQIVLNSEFDTFDRRHRYRGKFAYAFFKSWLECLAAECRRRGGAFQPQRDAARPQAGEFTLGVFASRSPLPPNLAQFILRIPLACSTPAQCTGV